MTLMVGYAFTSFSLRGSGGIVIPYFSTYKTEFLKQSQTFISILQDGSRSLNLFRKGKTHIIAKFHWTDLVICSHSKDRKTLSYSRRNTVVPSAHRVSFKSHLADSV